ASCGSRSHVTTVQELPPTKQKQKIAFLQKKIQIAEKEEKKIHLQIERLQDELRDAQLSYIRKQIDDYEDLLRKNSKKRETIDSGELFFDEREQLHRMIQNGGPTFEAQVVLDRILQLITILSDERSE